MQIGHYANYLQDHKLIHLDLTAATIAFAKEHLDSVIHELNRYVPGLQRTQDPRTVHAFGFYYEKSCEELEKKLPPIKVQFDTQHLFEIAPATFLQGLLTAPEGGHPMPQP